MVASKPLDSLAAGFLSNSQDAKKIYVLDQADVNAGMVEIYRGACLNRYYPGAAARGMTLEAIWLTPPLILHGAGNTLYFLWSFPNLEEFWVGRFADVEAKGEWWASTAHMVQDRKRSILTNFMREDNVYPPFAG